MSVQTEIDRINGLVNESHEKARAKGGTTATPLLANLPGVIDSIPQGAELPELTNPAQAYDLAYGKELIDADGNVVTGTLGEWTEGNKVFGTGEVSLFSSPGVTEFAVGAVYSPNNIGNNTVGCILRPGAVVVPRYIPTSLFGDATPDQVMKGVTFTSEAGLLVEGTHKCEGVVLSELGDAAAKPTDMLNGKTLYDDEGNPVTGTLPEVSTMLGLSNAPDSVISGSEEVQVISGMYTPTDFIARSTLKFRTRVPFTEFGDANPEDVAKGKTFTSAAGLLVEGTKVVNTETWVFTLENGSTVTKEVHIE